jgi:putative tricarboxylic transport membrane protein
VQRSEALVGLGFAGLGGLMLAQARAMPVLAHIEFGPGLFPSIVGGLMLLGGLALALRAAVATAGRDQGPAAAFLRPPRPLLLAAYGLAPIAYVVAAPWLGFILTTTLLVTVLARSAGVGLLRAAGLGVAVTLVIHLVFARLMRVALPYGFVETLLVRLPWP